MKGIVGGGVITGSGFVGGGDDDGIVIPGILVGGRLPLPPLPGILGNCERIEDPIPDDRIDETDGIALPSLGDTIDDGYGTTEAIFD